MPKVYNFRVSDFARPIANDVVNGTGIQGNTQTKRLSNLFFEAVRHEYGNSLADAIKDENNSGHLTQEEVLNTAKQLEKINDKVNNTSKKEIKAGCKRLQNIPESMRRKIEAEVRAKLTDEFLANFLLANDDDEDDAELLRFGAGGSVELPMAGRRR
jgi:glycyl-tRNA synthetase beta subunit